MVIDVFSDIDGVNIAHVNDPSEALLYFFKSEIKK
jgi:hypothetical protein